MAGRIPDHFIDELLARVDIVELVGDRVQLKKSGSNYHGLCPFHSEKTPSFTVAPTKQFYHCFGCGAHGTAIRFLMEYDRLEFRDAVAQLAQMAGMTIPEAARDEEPESHAEAYRVLARSAELYRGWLRHDPGRERAVSYLKGRGLTGEVAERFGIGFAPPGWDNLLRALGDRRRLTQAGMLIEREGGGVYDRFRDRIMFPIRDRRGRVIGFGGRVLDGGEPKYLNSPETPVFHKGRELYGLYEILQVDRHPADILIVEGYMDVVALAQHGLPRAVATLGTATSTQQVERLFRVTRDLVFCFDGDEAGRRAAWRALESTLPAMREGRQVRFLFLPEGEDPDSLVRHRGRAAFEAMLREAKPLSDFLLERLAEDVDTTARDSSTRLVEKAAPLLRQLPPDIFRRMLLERLSDLTRLEPAHIEAAATRRERPPRARATGADRLEASAVRRTPVRLAIALLLHRPGLAATVEDPEGLRELTLPGLSLLMQLLDSAGAEPNIGTGAILERFRGTEHEATLWKLATWDHMVPEDGMEHEFRDTVERLQALRKEGRLQYFNERLQRGELTREEWQEWTRLKQ